MDKSSKQVNHNYSQMVDCITSPQYKTTLCSQFSVHGNCPHVHNFQFSHGVQELRQSGEVQSEVKTVMCKMWMETGSCRNRSTCEAAHEQNEQVESADAGRIRDRVVGGAYGGYDVVGEQELKLSRSQKKKMKRKQRRPKEEEKKKEQKKEQKEIFKDFKDLKMSDIKKEKFEHKFREVDILNGTDKRLAIGYDAGLIFIMEFGSEYSLCIELHPALAHILSNLLSKLYIQYDKITMGFRARCRDRKYISAEVTGTALNADLTLELKESKNSNDKVPALKIPFEREIMRNLEMTISDFVKLGGTADIPSKFKENFRRENDINPAKPGDIVTSLSPKGYLIGNNWCGCAGGLSSKETCSPHCHQCLSRPWWMENKLEFDKQGGAVNYFLDNMLDDAFYVPEYWQHHDGPSPLRGAGTESGAVQMGNACWELYCLEHGWCRNGRLFF